MKHRHAVTIGEVTYEIEHLPPTTAVKILARLMKFVGPGLSGAKGIADAKLEDSLPVMLGELFARMDQQEVVSLIKELLSSCYKGINKVDMDYEFRGKIGAMMELVTESIKFQYADFFAFVVTAFSRAMAKPKQGVSNIQEESPSSSGDQS